MYINTTTFAFSFLFSLAYSPRIFIVFLYTEAQLGHQTGLRAKGRPLDTENIKKSSDQSITAGPCLGEGTRCTHYKQTPGGGQGAARRSTAYAHHFGVWASKVPPGPSVGG